MVSSLPVSIAAEGIYPDRNNNPMIDPMADNTRQFYGIVKIKENVEYLYAEYPNFCDGKFVVVSH